MVALRRRGLLLAGAAVLLPGCGSSGRPAEKRRDREGDVEVLNRMLRLERQSVAIYSAAGSGPLVRRLLDHEREHVAALEGAVRRLGGTAAAGAAGDAGTPADVLRFARRVEETAVAAYLDALPQVADGEARELLASIVATEAEHLTAVEGALGLPQAEDAFVTARRSL